MIRLRSLLLLGLLLFVTVACSARSATGERRDPSRITLQEIERGHYSTVYELIQSQRPQWLRVRGGMSLSGPSELVVYVDNVRFGPVTSLQSVSATEVDYLERIDATAATQRWGTGHTGGVIYVQTRRMR